MDIICLRSKNISGSEIKKITNVLKNNGLAIFPTDTVYGLAGSAGSGSAIEKIYQLKQRPKDKPFIIFITDIDFIDRIKVEITPRVRKLLNAFWPGAVTFVFKNNGNGFSRYLGDKIAVRIPDHTVILDILKGFNDPLVVTSANISGEGSPAEFDEIDAGILDNIDIAIDAGRCKFSLASTIVDISGNEPEILREGAVSAEKIMKEWEVNTA